MVRDLVGECLGASYDAATGSICVVLRRQGYGYQVLFYNTDKVFNCPDDTFKAGIISGNYFYVQTGTEVAVYD